MLTLRGRLTFWMVAPAALAALTCRADPMAGEPGSEPASGTVLLSGSSYLRLYTMRFTAQVQRENGAVEHFALNTERTREVKPVLYSSAPPPEDWRDADFDDGEWPRLRDLSLGAGDAPIGLVCARGKFEVRDPARAGELTLSVAFKGGLVVSLNGREIARASMPAGEIGPETPAEVYPSEAYLDSGGELVRNEWGDPQRFPEVFKRRVRNLSVKLPGELLRKGTNVLAIEVHRSPLAALWFTAKEKKWGRPASLWLACSLDRLELRAGAGSSAVPNVGRPRGFQVWNQPVAQRVCPADYGDPNEPLRPVKIQGARNGAFSGQVVLGSPAPIRGLKVSAGELESEAGGAIPSSAITVRFAQIDQPGQGWFDGLHPETPAEVAVAPGGDAAVQPLWIAVRVPREAKSGAYAGKLTVGADGVAPLEIPVRLQVADWELPDSQSFRVHVGAVQSADSVAMRYDVPMWSEKHWALLEKSFALLGQVGNDTVHLQLIRRTNFGNEHSMLRWIKQEDGSWKHDYGIIERYLDLAVRHLGKPRVVCLQCWDSYCGGMWMFAKADSKGKGVGFTILDPKTGRLEEGVGPEYGTPELREFWKPVFAGLREVLRKRGLEGAMMVGIAHDSRPSKATVEDLAALLPGVPWEMRSHPDIRELHGQPVGYLSTVWGTPPVTPTLLAQPRKHGWNNPYLINSYWRKRNASPLPKYRNLPDEMLTVGFRGVGDLGADFWPVLKDGHGRLRTPLFGRFPESRWQAALEMHNTDPALLAPGRDGAVPTVRFEMLRAGLQESEARIAVEKVLVDPKLKSQIDRKLVERAFALLDERNWMLAAVGDNGPGWPWFLPGAQERSGRLYELAAEVARAAGK